MKLSNKLNKISQPHSEMTSGTSNQSSQSSSYHQVLPQFVMNALESVPNREILHYFHEDTHTSLTAKEASDTIRQGALALKNLGIQPKECVGIMMKSSPHWLMAEQMIQAIGGISIGIYDNITFKSLNHYVQQTELTTVFIDQEVCYEILQPFHATLKHIIIKDDLFHRLKKDPSLKHIKHISWSELLSKGSELNTQHPTQFQEELAKLSPDEVCAIVYTSGSTNMPKGVPLTHQDFVFQATAAAERYRLIGEGTHALSILPIAHMFERTVIYFYLSIGISINFLSDPTKLIGIIGKVRPNIMTAVPRLLERVHEAMLHKAHLKPFPLKNLAVSAINRAANRVPLSPKGFLDNLYERLVYKKLRQALGGNLDFIISGGVALDPRTLRFFFSIGVPVYEGYGLTETAPVIACGNHANFKPYSVGKVLDGINTKISDEGELLIQSPSLMKEYFKNPEQTAKVLKPDSQGNIWFHTGDKARLEEGFVFIEGRVKEFFKTSVGKYVNPILIEKQLTHHKWVNNSLIIGERRKFISALIFIDPVEIIPSKNTRENIEKAIESWVEQTNTTLETWERIKKYKIVWKLLTIKDNELTPKMNIKRSILEKKFVEIIDELYNK